MNRLVQILFIVDIGVLYVLFIGVIWSVAFPAKRIWPPPGKKSWQYGLTWICFYLSFAINAVLFLFDWNSWVFKSGSRFYLGIPVAISGALLVSWGIATLGTRNTSGQRAGFVKEGPYRYMRNPQYLGDMILFLGLSLIANSWMLWITHALLILVFLITPLAEEPWLADQYGEAYLTYKRDTARFL